jgi:hypothetical protein
MIQYFPSQNFALWIYFLGRKFLSTFLKIIYLISVGLILVKPMGLRGFTKCNKDNLFI